MKFSAFIATSLDGFIADSRGRIDWLNQANSRVPAGEDCGFSAYFAAIDVMVMGRNTFEQVRQFAEWPYGTKPVYVLSRSLTQLPTATPDTVELTSLPPLGLAETLRDRGFNHAYVDGGQVIQVFLAAGLLSDITITSIPVVLGAGVPLFGHVDAAIWLTLVHSKAYPFGFVQTTFQISSDHESVKQLPPAMGIVD
jgi:dihydrofolate reductase